jgi:DNA-binding beta-propeller fold protein YncE
VSEWSRAVVVTVYPYPGYPAYREWYISLPEDAAVAVDDSLTVAVAASADSIVTVSLLTRQRLAARQFASAGRLSLSPDGQRAYVFRRDTAFVLAVADLSTTDTLLIGSDYSAVLALDSALLLCREPDVVRYDLQLHRYTDSVELSHVTTLTRSPGGRIFAWSSYSQSHVVELEPSLDRILRNYVVRGYATGLGFDPASDDLWVSSLSDDSSRFTCFSAASGRLQRELAVEDRPSGGFDLSPVKPWLVYPFDGGRSLRVIDTRDGRMIDLVGFSYYRDYHISSDGSEAVACTPGSMCGFSVYK